jgi:hypothetical protein
MSGTMHQVGFAFTTEDVDNVRRWAAEKPAEHQAVLALLERADALPGTLRGDVELLISAELRDVMMRAGEAYVAQHALAFRVGLT